MRLSVALHALVLALVAAVYAPVLHAAPVDVSAVASGVADQLLAVSLVGAAVLLVFGGLAALGYVRAVMGVESTAFDASRDLAPHVRGYVDQQSYLDALASRLAARDEFFDGPVEFKENDFAPPLSAEESAAHDAFEASYRDMWASQSQAEVVVVVDRSSGGFDAADMGTWSYGHHAAYQAGLTEVRDSEGERSWTTEQWIAFDEGRDAHHRAYLASTGDLRTDDQRMFDKEVRKGAVL